MIPVMSQDLWRVFLLRRPVIGTPCTTELQERICELLDVLYIMSYSPHGHSSTQKEHLMHLKRRQRGSVQTSLMIIFGVIAVLAGLYYFGVPDEASKAVSAGVGFIAGLLAGGWFVAAGAGMVAETFLWLLVLGPALVMLILSERGDPRCSFWWERDVRNDATSHAITVSVIYVATLFLLDYGGIPIWETITNATWPMQVAGVTAYVIIGIAWREYRWNDLSRHLHQRRAAEIQEALDEARKMFSQLLQSEADIRKKFHLADVAQLPALRPVGDIHSWARQYAHLASNTGVYGDIPSSLRDLYELLREHERLTEQVWSSFFSKDVANEKFRESIPVDVLRLSISHLDTGRVPSVLGVYLQEFESKWVTKVSAGDYMGQLYLWTLFWPWSMGFRLLRKILTLKILRDFIVYMSKSLRFLDDRVAARHKKEFEMVAVEFESPTPPTENDKAVPIRQQAEKGDLI